MIGSTQRLSAFLSDRDGQVAIIFALVALPVLGITGMAIDYGRAMNAQRQMQLATDAAALAAASAKNKTDAERESIALTTFHSNTRAAEFIASVNPTYTVVAGRTTVRGEVVVPAPFMSLTSFPGFHIEAESSVATAGKKLELALMFDVTGSMTGSTAGGTSTKIQDAKAAAGDLIDIVMPSGMTSTRMSLIPFSQRVKLDADTAAAVSFSTPTKQVAVESTSSETTYSLSFNSPDWKKWSKCVDRLADDYYKKLGESSSTAESHAETYCGTLQTRWNSSKNRTEYLTPDVKKSTDTIVDVTYHTEYIRPCVVERDTSSSSRATGEHAPVEGEWEANYSTTETGDVSCPPNGNNGAGSLVPLTSDRTKIASAIDALQTGGSTAGHLGTAWSWYTLSPEWRTVWKDESDPVDYSDETTIKAAVLMTDGAYNSCGGSSSWCAQSATDAVAICNKMKAQGIQVWTIGFGMSQNVNDPARQTLVQCADAGRYFFPYNGDELREAFQAIGKALSDATTKARLVE